MTHDYSDFEALLVDKMKERGLSIKQLSELSGIASKHLENMANGNYDQLPPSPYLRGYLTALGQILDFDADHWWHTFQVMGVLRSSGQHDQMPKNRFAKKSGKLYVGLIATGVLLVIYLGFRFSNILGMPTLAITTPGQDVIRVLNSPLVFSGTLKNGSTLTINGEMIPIGADGSWTKDVALDPGPNAIQVDAKKFLGGEVKVVRQIWYEAPQGATSTPTAIPGQ
jgi:hypothetical protein